MLVERIYVDEEHGSVSLKVVGGQKRYLRVWPDEGLAEWAWVLNESNELVWDRNPQRADPSGDLVESEQ